MPVQGKKETIDIVAEMEDSASNVARSDMLPIHNYYSLAHIDFTLSSLHSSSTSDIKGTETANYDNVAGSERVEQEATATDKQSERYNSYSANIVLWQSLYNVIWTITIGLFVLMPLRARLVIVPL